MAVRTTAGAGRAVNETRRPGGKELPAALRPGNPLFGLGYAPPVVARGSHELRDDARVSHEVDVAEEVPVAFVYNGRAHVVMMATPADLEDFAYGFTLDEGIVARAADIERLEVVRFSEGIELQMLIPSADADRLAARGRQLVGRTGCGLCGVETIREALRPVRAVGERRPIAVEALWRAELALGSLQTLNHRTGAMHAAAFAARDGALAMVREDVGRHNALDKVLGVLARSERDGSDGFLCVTSRASYELVQKASTAGVPLLAAISRPTGLAIRLAEAAGMTLVGLLRGRSAVVYAGAGGIVAT